MCERTVLRERRSCCLYLRYCYAPFALLLGGPHLRHQTRARRISRIMPSITSQIWALDRMMQTQVSMCTRRFNFVLVLRRSWSLCI